MADLNLDHLRKVAEAAKAAKEAESVERMLRDGATFSSEFNPATALTLIAELEALRNWKAEALPVLSAWRKVWIAAGNPGRLGEPMAETTEQWVRDARITAQEDRRYIEETEGRMKPYLAKAWDEGWDDGNYYAISDFDQGAKSKNPYTTP